MSVKISSVSKSTKSPNWRSLEKLETGAAADVGPHLVRDECKTADRPTSLRQVELDASRHRDDGQLGSLLDGQAVEILEIAELGIDPGVLILDPDDHVDAAMERDADVKPDDRTSEVAALERELLVEEVEDLALGAIERPAESERRGAFGCAEEEVFGLLRGRWAREESSCQRAHHDRPHVIDVKQLACQSHM